jgi:chromosome segregation ATPase
MNQFYADQKANKELRRQLELKNEEIAKLKAEAQQRDDFPASLSNSQKRIDEVQAEIDQLNQSFSSDLQGSSSPRNYDDDCGFQIYVDDAAADEFPASDGLDAVGSELESARQAKQSLFRSSQGSFSNIIHFEDSPVRPSNRHSQVPSPPQNYELLSKQLQATTNRAEEAEVALKALDLEIQSLGFPANGDDANDCIWNIKKHFREMRIELERLVPGETVTSFDNAKLMPEILAKLKMVGERARDREAELKSMREQQRCLKGNFDHAIVAAEKANSRVKELEEAIDNNAEEMLEIRMRAQAWERESNEHEKNNQSLIVAIEKYRAEVEKLEELVTLIETEQAARLQEVRTATTAEFTQQLSDMDAKVAAETRGRQAAEESAVDRLKKINELESSLSTARQQADDVKEQLARLEEQFHTSKRSHAEQLAAYEEEVGGFNSRIAGLSTALASANAEIEKFKKLNSKLDDRYRAEINHAFRAVDRMNTEIARATTKFSEERKGYVRGATMRHANWEIESDDLVSDPILPMTPASVVRFSSPDYYDDDHVEGSVEVSRGKTRRRGSIVPGMSIMKKPRRRYDSGIGMGSLSEVDEDDDISNDIMTPDLSSDPPVETEHERDVEMMI